MLYNPKFIGFKPLPSISELRETFRGSLKIKFPAKNVFWLRLGIVGKIRCSIIGNIEIRADGLHIGCSITSAESKVMETWMMDSGWSSYWISLQITLKILEFDVENYLFWGLWVTIHLIEYIFLRILAHCALPTFVL